MFLNVFPAMWFFLVLYWDLVPKARTAPAFLAAAFAAVSVFSFVNFGYALFGARPLAEYLYTPDEINDLAEKKVLEENHSCHFILLAVIYLLLFPLLAMLASWWA